LEPNATPGNVLKPGAAFTKQDGGRYYTLSPKPNLLIPGDSGGGEFIFNPPDKKPYLVGINDAGDCVNSSATIGFVPRATVSYAVAMPALREWIHAVLSSSWDVKSSASNIWVSPAEVSGTRWPVGDVNNARWAQSARASSAMCYARGFAGGHFDGHQGKLADRPGSGIVCSGGDTRWFDVTRAQFPKPWDFADVNTVSWAQASRAAAGICTSPPDGSPPYVGGQFNGHMRGGQYGVFCYRSAQFFDAKDNEGAFSKWSVDTGHLDSVPWAQAARAATDFCHFKGFGGGFMTGHHVPNASGIVCQS
jgi:hypothetical protein